MALSDQTELTIMTVEGSNKAVAEVLDYMEGHHIDVTASLKDSLSPKGPSGWLPNPFKS